MSNSKRGKDSNSYDNNNTNSIVENLSKDLAEIEKTREILLSIKKRYDLEKESEIELTIPATIFNKNLTILESSVKFLKEENNLNFKQISNILNRDQRNIWQIYNKSKQKYPKKISGAKSKYFIPFSVITDDKLSAQESIVFYLKKSHSLSFSDIARIMKRDDRTIWTVYNRAKVKHEK